MPFMVCCPGRLRSVLAITPYASAVPFAGGAGRFEAAGAQCAARDLVASFTDLSQALREQRVDIAIRGNIGIMGVQLCAALHRGSSGVRFRTGRDKKGSRNPPLVYRSHPYVELALRFGRYIKGPEAAGLEVVGALVATGYYQGLFLPTMASFWESDSH